MSRIEYEDLDKKLLSDKELEVIDIMRKADKLWVPHWEVARDSSMSWQKASKALEKLRHRGILVKRKMEDGPMPSSVEYSFKEGIHAFKY